MGPMYGYGGYFPNSEIIVTPNIETLHSTIADDINPVLPYKDLKVDRLFLPMG